MMVMEMMRKLHGMGLSLSDAKVMVHALSEHHEKKNQLRIKMELAYARELLGELEDPSEEIQVYLAEGFEPQSETSWERTRIGELEMRCREHRQKRAEQVNNINRLVDFIHFIGHSDKCQMSQTGSRDPENCELCANEELADLLWPEKA